MTCCVTWLTLLLLICCDVEANPGPPKIDQTRSTTTRLNAEFLEEDARLIYSKRNFESNLAKKIKYNSNFQIDLNKVAEFPNHYILAEFSALSYENLNNSKAFAALPQGWELITAASNKNVLNGYFGIALWHQENGHILIAHRGTDVANSGSLFTDLWSVVFEQNGEQMNSACTFILKIKQIILKSRNKRIQLFITGHSLGGWLAQFTTLIVKYFGLNNNKIAVDSNVSNIQFMHAHTVVFESPGCKEMLLLTQKVYNIKYNARNVDITHLDITNYLTTPNAVNTYGRHIGTVLALFGDNLTTEFIHSIKDHGIIGIIKKLKANNKLTSNVEEPRPMRQNTIIDTLLFIPRILFQYIYIFFAWLFNIEYVPSDSNISNENNEQSVLYYVKEWPRMNYSDHLTSIYTDILNISESTQANLNISLNIFDKNRIDVRAFTNNEIYLLHIINISITLNKNILSVYFPGHFLNYKLNKDAIYIDNPMRFQSFIRQFVRQEDSVTDIMKKLLQNVDINHIISYIQRTWSKPTSGSFKLNKNSTVYNIVKNTLTGINEKALVIISNHDTKLWSQIISSSFSVMTFDYRVILNLLPLYKIAKISHAVKGRVVINFPNLEYSTDCFEIINEINYVLPNLAKQFIFVVKGNSDEKATINEETFHVLQNQNVCVKDLNIECQTIILNSRINFQGKFLKIKNIITDSKEVINIEVFDLIENYNNVTISNTLEFDDTFYIERTLTKQNNRIFVGDIDALPGILPDAIIANVKENKDFNDRAIIVANSGSGKTTFMHHIAIKIKDENPYFWVIYINLLKSQFILDNININDNNIHISLLTAYIGIKTKFEEQLFSYYMSIDKKLIILFDGYDEIENNNKAKVNIIINKILNEKISRVYISSSPSLAKYLQNSLSVYMLDDMSYQDQLTFFKHYNITNQTTEIVLRSLNYLSQDNIRNFCEVPLQMKLLVSILKERRNENIYFQNIFNIYKKYIEIMMLKYNEKNNSRHEDSIVRYAHQILSIKYLFPNVNTKEIDTYNVLNKISFENINKIKLVHVSNNIENIKFVHPTIATYLTAEFITNKIIALKEIKIHELEVVGNVITNFELIKKLISIFIDPNYKIIRVFINDFLRDMQNIRIVKQKIISERIKMLVTKILDTTGYSYNLILHISGLENLLHVMKFTTSFFTETKIVTLLNSTVKYDTEYQILQAVNDTKPWDWLPFPIRTKVTVNDTKIPSQLKITPLSLAAMMGHTEIIQYMLDLGADINILNEDKMTSLHLAVINNKQESVKTLLNNSNIDVNIRDKNLNTALHFAAFVGNIDIIVMLIDSNIELDAINDKGEAALTIAQQNYKDEIVKILSHKIDHN